MKRKHTAAQKAERKKTRERFQTIFVHGKMKRVPRPVMIDGLSTGEFIARNADPLWLHQNGMWDLIPFDLSERSDGEGAMSDDDIPF